MQETAEAVEVALRVLSALIHDKPPKPADIRALISYAPQEEYTLDQLDQIACDVIRIAVKQMRADAGAHG